MFPKINNKSLLDCTEEDLQTLIDNTDYRENEYIDYKKLLRTWICIMQKGNN